MIENILQAYHSYQYHLNEPDDEGLIETQRALIDTINFTSKSITQNSDFYDCTIHDEMFRIARDSLKNRGTSKEFEEWAYLTGNLLKPLNRKFLHDSVSKKWASEDEDIAKQEINDIITDMKITGDFNKDKAKLDKNETFDTASELKKQHIRNYIQYLKEAYPGKKYTMHEEKRNAVFYMVNGYKYDYERLGRENLINLFEGIKWASVKAKFDRPRK